MTAAKYMRRQVARHKLNYEQAKRNNAPEADLQNISKKIGYYSLALAMLEEPMVDEDYVRVVRCKKCVYWQDNNGGYPHDECRWGKDETPDADDFCSFGERCAE